jgi:hypothetical protein
MALSVPGVSTDSNFRLKSALDSHHSVRGLEDWGRVRLLVLGNLAMGPAQPPHSRQEGLGGSSFERDDFADDDCMGDDIVSLLEENARLRKLVLSLSEMVLRNVADAN